jgi:4-amino-4-deoxy-L-arabinose transferase-like glycosyltransferase
VVVIVAAVVALYLSPLFLDAPLTDPDEGLHAVISQEMVEHGDLIVPRFLGRAFLDKPILYFWAQSASLAIFGMNTAAARLPGMLFALFGIATTGWLASILFDAHVGWIAAICYATMALPFLLAQAPVHDIALVPFTNLTLGFLWRSRESSVSRFAPVTSHAPLALAGIALGLSVLTKGLEGVALAGIAYGLYLLTSRQITWNVVRQGVIVLAIAAIIAVPWYLAMEARQPGYLRYYFIDRHLLGFATDTQRHGGQPWWFYVPLAIGGGLPWILYSTEAQERFAPASGKWARPGMLAWTWFIGAVALLSFSGSKAVTYVLPAMPAVAILAARTWVAALAADALRPAVDRIRRRRLVHAGSFFIIAALTPWAAARFGDEPIRTVEVAAFGALSVAWLALLIAQWRSAAGDAWPYLVAMTGATYALAFTLLGPPLARSHSGRDLAEYFNRLGRVPGTIYVMDQRVAFVYYLRPDLRRQLRPDRVQNVSAEQLGSMRLFPTDAVIGLPADLTGRLSGLGTFRDATRHDAGRYVVIARDAP